MLILYDLSDHIVLTRVVIFLFVRSYECTDMSDIIDQNRTDIEIDLTSLNL